MDIVKKSNKFDPTVFDPSNDKEDKEYVGQPEGPVEDVVAGFEQAKGAKKIEEGKKAKKKLKKQDDETLEISDLLP